MYSVASQICISCKQLQSTSCLAHLDCYIAKNKNNINKKRQTIYFTDFHRWICNHNGLSKNEENIFSKIRVYRMAR